MAADYYTADTENGDHVDDPSEDVLFPLIGDLNDSDTTFITVEPATGGSLRLVRHDRGSRIR